MFDASVALAQDRLLAPDVSKRNSIDGEKEMSIYDLVKQENK